MRWPTIQTLVNPNPAEDLGALKLFQIPTGDSAGAERALKRLEQEIEALTALRNEPGIVKLLDSGLPGHWIVTEYQPGGTLADRTERYRGDALAALQAFRPLVQAVAALHGRAEVVVHRDIKLSNIFVAADGRLVLGDFGIVYVGGGSRATATHGERVGDRDWMPPWANVRQRIEHPDPTLDVFPLGKVLMSTEFLGKRKLRPPDVGIGRSHPIARNTLAAQGDLIRPRRTWRDGSRILGRPHPWWRQASVPVALQAQRPAATTSGVSR